MELPKFAKSRLALGTQVRWMEFGAIDLLRHRPRYVEKRADHTSAFRRRMSLAHATFRPMRWFDIDGEIGLLSPSLQRWITRARAGGRSTDVRADASVDDHRYAQLPRAPDQRRAAARRGGALRRSRHRRVHASSATKVKPPASCRSSASAWCWRCTDGSSHDADEGSVPFYLQPSLGGPNSLRSFADYRFHDRNMLLANAELRIAMMTHVDLAVFADAGNVAARVRGSESRQAVVRRRPAPAYAARRPSRASTWPTAPKAGASCSA